MIAKRGSVEAERKWEPGPSDQRTESGCGRYLCGDGEVTRPLHNKTRSRRPRRKYVHDIVDWLRAPATIYIGLAGVPVPSLRKHCEKSNVARPAKRELA